MAESPRASAYDACSAEYATYFAWREHGGIDADPMGILRPMLDLLGDVAGQYVLRTL